MKRLIIGAVVAALAALAVAPPAQANHSWNGYHWARTSNPFTVKTGDNVTSQWDAYLREAAADWTKSTVLDLTVVAGTVSNVKRCVPPSGRIEVCNATYGFNGWLGIAGVSVSGGHIVAGYTKLNDSYYNTSTYNKPEWRRFVTCQELGHDIGLDHQDENFNNANMGTCQDYTNTPLGPPSNEHPDAHDYDQLLSIYAHTDSTSTVGATAPTGPGKSKSMIAHGDEIIHVLWAPIPVTE